MKRVIAEAELYMDLIVPEDELRFCFELVDTGEAVTIVLKEEPEIVEGSIDPDVRLFTTRPVFDSILRGEADIFSLTARAKMTDVRPVNFEIFTKEKAARAPVNSVHQLRAVSDIELIWLAWMA